MIARSESYYRMASHTQTRTSLSKKKFVEANPNTPENPPDEVKQFSFRDQQAAQPEITQNNRPDLAPKINGSKRSVKIVDAFKKH